MEYVIIGFLFGMLYRAIKDSNKKKEDDPDE